MKLLHFKKNSALTAFLYLAISIIFTILIGFYVAFQLKALLLNSLKKQVSSIVETSSLNFSYDTLDKIQGRESIYTDEYRNIVLMLQAIKLKNPALRFVDIYRKTNNPNFFEYVADSNSLRPDIPVDDNGDGVINELDEPIFPGDIYDASVSPSFVKNAFLVTDIAESLEQSQWGLTFDASAPIINFGTETRYAINVSVDASDYLREINLAFIPFSVFVFILVMNLFILSLALLRSWNAQVHGLQDLDRQKDELLGMVSHQLAKPITAIKWNLESMIDGDIGNLNPEQKESAGTMQSMATNLADLVSMILDVSRIQLGKVKIDAQPLDLNEFFLEIVSVIEPTIKEKKISFVQDIYPKKLPTVLLDKRYTRMTIENLLTNAIKYTPEGGTVKLWVQVTNNTLHCSVSDTGCGIPKAEQDKIFGKMYRATNVRNTMDGNGFGLYVAKGAVEGQGGRIWFQSTEGKGTTFFVDLPAKPADIKVS